MSFAILFGRPRTALIDDRFELDAYAAEELEIDSHAIPLEPIVDGDASRALARLPDPRGRTWIYRGWMLSEEEYTALHDAMIDRGESLLVDPDAFASATYAPRYIPLLGAHTTPSRWTDDDDIDEAWELACELGPPPWIVKDHVKSAKEEWYRACFVREGADLDDFRATCERLLELRGDRFERGFVIKKYLDLAPLRGTTPERRPVTDEHRSSSSSAPSPRTRRTTTATTPRWRTPRDSHSSATSSTHPSSPPTSPASETAASPSSSSTTAAARASPNSSTPATSSERSPADPQNRTERSDPNVPTHFSAHWGIRSQIVSMLTTCDRKSKNQGKMKVQGAMAKESFVTPPRLRASITEMTLP
jgi:hypothetical protein